MRTQTSLFLVAGMLAASIGVRLAAQGQGGQQPAAPAPPAGQGDPAPAPAGRGGAARGGGAAPAAAAGQNFRLTFPAAQRGPGDPALIAKGRALYDINCRLCHGADLRGGDMGGVNLMRSQIVLNDQKGELIFPVVRDGRTRPGMLPMPALGLPMDDVVAIAEFMHGALAGGRGGGAGAPLNLLVGDAAAGKTFFDATCSGCHSATGDMARIGSRIPDVMALQNTWVAGMPVGGRDAPTPKPSKVTVTPATGAPVVGDLVRVDDFLVAIKLADGTERSFRRNGDVPRVAITSPREGHMKLWPTLQDRTMHDVTAYLVTLK